MSNTWDYATEQTSLGQISDWASEQGLEWTVGLSWAGPLGWMAGGLLDLWPEVEMPNLALKSPTYASTPRNTVDEGIAIPKIYGYCFIAGNVIRMNDGTETSIKMIVGHCLGPIDSIVAWKINDLDFSLYEKSLSGGNWRDYKTGTATQTVIQKGGSDFFDIQNCAYRGLAYSALFFSSEEEAIRNTPNVFVFLRSESLPIGGGAEIFTRSPANAGYDFYNKVLGVDSTELDENAFNSLKTLADAYPTQTEGTAYYPPGPSTGTAKATSQISNRRGPYRCCNPNSTIEGSPVDNAWLTAEGTAGNVRLNLDFGIPFKLTKIEVVNYHNSGSSTTAGIKNFKIQGSNVSTAFDNVTFATDTDWTDVATGLVAVAYSASDPWQIFLQNVSPHPGAFRYYSLKITDSIAGGGGSYVGIRKVIFYGISPRYCFDYCFDTKNPVADFKSELFRSFEGAIIRSQGKYKPVFEWNQEADGSGGLTAKTVRHAFTTNNIIKGSFRYWKPERANVIIINYRDINQQLTKKSVTVKDNADISERGEVVFEESCDFIINEDAAWRRAQRALKRGKYTNALCELAGSIASCDLELFDLVTVTHPVPIWTAKEFLVIGKKENEYGTSTFTLRAYASGIYDDQVPPFQRSYFSGLPNPSSSLAPVENVSVTDAGFWDNSGLYNIRVQVTYDIPNDSLFWSYGQIYYSTNDSDYYLYEKTDISRGLGYYILGNDINLKVGETLYVKVVPVSTLNAISNISDATAGSLTITVDLQDAVDDLPASGGRLLLPAGTYTLADVITMPDKNIDIIGINRGEVIIENNPGDGCFYLEDLTKKFRFENIQINSQNTSTYSKMIEVITSDVAHPEYNTADIEIYSCTILLKGPAIPSAPDTVPSTGDVGLYFYYGQGDIDISHVSIYGESNAIASYGMGTVGYSGTINISYSNCTHCVYGIYISTCSGGVMVNSNISRDFFKSGIYIYVTSNGANIYGNTVVSHNGAVMGSTPIYGIFGQVTNVKIDSNYIKIIHSSIYQNTYGIATGSGDYEQCNNNNILINLSGISSAGTGKSCYGIALTNGNNCTIQINSIQINNPDLDTASYNNYGILLTQADRNNLTSNNIDLVTNGSHGGNDYGIYLSSAGTSSDYNQGGDNITYNCSTGISDNGTGNAVTGLDV